jgi:hypothetical protein
MWRCIFITGFSRPIQPSQSNNKVLHPFIEFWLWILQLSTEVKCSQNKLIPITKIQGLDLDFLFFQLQALLMSKLMWRYSVHDQRGKIHRRKANPRKFTNSNQFSLPTDWLILSFGVLTPLSTIFQLYHGDQFKWWRKPEYPEKTTDHGPF